MLLWKVEATSLVLLYNLEVNYILDSCPSNADASYGLMVMAVPESNFVGGLDCGLNILLKCADW